MNKLPITSFKGSYAFLSNFYPAPVTWGGMDFPTVEHAYQAAKSIDASDREIIRNAKTPGQAKRLGSRVKVIRMPADWKTGRVQVMQSLVWMKFSKHPELKKKLLDTGDRILIEGNTWGDEFWGVCNGVGLNKLGRILMDARAGLRSIHVNARNANDRCAGESMAYCDPYGDQS